MCYNYSLTSFQSLDEYNAVFLELEKVEPVYYVNSFSIPTMPVITNEEPRKFQFYSWGLIPFWVKKIDDAEKIRTQTMNARAETLFDKPSFRHSIRNKRCLIPADGFFEWRYILGRNYPYYIYLKNHKVFSFAGIWDSWYNPKNDELVYTYSIITCEPNNLLRKIHNKKKRMPVILPWDLQEKWINNTLSEQDIKSFLIPYPDDDMETFTISRLITSKTQERNVPRLIEPYSYPELKGIE